MPNTYSWVISQLECYPEHEGRNDVVLKIHWKRRATNGVQTSEIYGAQVIEYAAADPFTPYNELTQAQVEAWLNTAMGPANVANLNARLDFLLNTLEDPVFVNPSLPW